MSTRQTTRQPHPRRTRLATSLIALSALIAIGLALLILTPTSVHRTTPHRPNTATAIHTHPIAAAVVTRPTAGCFRDPVTHALFCSASAPAPFGIPTPPGYVRDSGTPELMRVANTPDPAGHLPAGHSRGRIIP